MTAIGPILTTAAALAAPVSAVPVSSARVEFDTRRIDKIRVTGNKLEQKKYYRHSGFPGGLKERTLQEQLDRHPEEVIRKAVKGMVPRNRMGAAQLKKLKIYQGADHPHENFNPQPLPGVQK